MFKEEDDFIANLKSSRRLKSSFVLASKMIKTARNGKDYLEFSLTDKTGVITARMFTNKDAQEIYDNLHEKSIYEINGSVDEFPRNSGNFSIKVDGLNKLGENEYDLEDFTRTSSKDSQQLLEEIYSTINEMKNNYLKSLLESLFNDEKFVKDFTEAPSAKIYHHNYLGGLLEHTVEVLIICRTVYELFPQLNADLLYTGAILHDVGKIKNYEYDLTSIDISNEGILLDHLYISCDMVKEKMKEIKTPEDIQLQVLHLILSHHGEVKNGWGSPVNPKTPEAVALHYADNLDAKVKGILQNL
jgi:3'-5' exoribonuclease